MRAAKALWLFAACVLCSGQCGAFLLPPTPGPSGLTQSRGAVSKSARGSHCTRGLTRLGMGQKPDDSLQSLAERLEQGMNSWSEPAPDSLPPKKGNAKKNAQAAQQRGPPPPAGPPKSRDEMVVRVSATRAGKGGKTVTEVTGMESMSKTEARTVLKKIKEKISVGGRVTDEMVLEVQGDQCETVVKILLEEGFSDTKRAGGKLGKKKSLQ